MSKIASQLIGAAAVIATAAAGLAYAQTTEKPASTTAGTVYEGGVNNGSTYVRSNQLGNAADAERPAANTTRQDRSTTPNTNPANSMPNNTSSSASDTPATSGMNGATTGTMDRNSNGATSNANSNASNSSSDMNADGTLAARSDRN